MQMNSMANVSSSGSQDQQWTEILQPRTRLLDLRLKEVWRYRDLLMLFVKRDFTAAYRQTILGPLWHIIQPVFTSIMFLVVFNKIAKIPTDTLPPILFYMCSITIWNYFAACLGSTSATFVSNAGIFGKVYFPRLVSPLSVVLSNIVRFGIQFSLLIGMIAYYGLSGLYVVHIGWQVLLVPVFVLVMAAMGLGLGIIISSLTTKYRDLTILISFGVQLLMYITPVAYPLSYLGKSEYAGFIKWNPLSPLVEGFRYAILGQGAFDAGYFLYSVLIAMVALFSGIILFNRVERSFMDTV